MVLPIYLYGNAVLKEKSKIVETMDGDITQLIADMWETMYFAKGVGLAAPQVGRLLRLFVVDTSAYDDNQRMQAAIKKVFVNPTIVHEGGPLWDFEEGCLSIPGLVGDVSRHAVLTIRYQDAELQWHEDTYDGMNARVIQHEYDHIEGILFIDRIKPLRRQMLQRKLDRMKKGVHDAKYPVKALIPIS